MWIHYEGTLEAPDQQTAKQQAEQLIPPEQKEWLQHIRTDITATRRILP